MNIKFNYRPPRWDNAGTEPSESIKQEGFSAGYKPPAGFFNWFWNLVYKCLDEIQNTLIDYKTNLSQDVSGILPVSSGGTGATTTDSAMEQLGIKARLAKVYSLEADGTKLEANASLNSVIATGNYLAATDVAPTISNIPCDTAFRLIVESVSGTIWQTVCDVKNNSWTRCNTINGWTSWKINLTLGETDKTAYRGDRGKAAYDHSAKTSGNPHRVTKTDVGLGDVDNTPDIEKPVSMAMRDALGSKVDKETGKGLSTNDFTNAYKSKLDNAVALGETAQTAYRGDRGKAAYDHSVKTSGNPHRVTKSDIGLGNVDNTPDADKPVSTAVQTALNKKVDKVTGKGLSTNDFTTAYKTKLDNVPEDINLAITLSEENKSRYGAGTFNQAFNKAVQILTAAVPASGWSSAPTSAGWYENRVNVSAMKAVYNPLLDLVITSAALAEDERAAFGLIMEAETFDGYVIFRALDVPDISINVRFVGV